MGIFSRNIQEIILTTVRKFNPLKVTSRLSQLNMDVRSSVLIGDKRGRFMSINYIVLQ